MHDGLGAPDGLQEHEPCACALLKACPLGGPAGVPGGLSFDPGEPGLLHQSYICPAPQPAAAPIIGLPVAAPTPTPIKSEPICPAKPEKKLGD